MSASLPAVSAATQALRTLALVGASGAGKTTLSEALLAAAGVLSAPGSVERGATVSDHDPLEKRHLHSLQSSVLHLTWKGTQVQAIDTPGMPDFIGHALQALEAVDTAVLVINAQTGIEPTALRLMQQAAERGLDRMIVVNKIDAPGVNLPQLLAELQASFGKECLPLNLPAAGGARVTDCFFNREGDSDFGDVAAAHRALVEQVVEVDGDFVDRYLNEGDIDASELHAPLEQALREGHLIPVCFTAAKSGVGVEALLEAIDKLLPHPGEGNPPPFHRGEGEAARPLTATLAEADHVLAHVFKVTVDPYLGKLGVMRVHQGVLRPGAQLFVGDGRKPFKLQHLYRMQGREHLNIDQAVPGELCAIAKVDELHHDAVLHDAAEDAHIHLKPPAFPTPVHGLALEPQRRGDEQRLWDALSKLVEEDPCLRIERDAVTHDTVVYGLGEWHLRVLLERLREQHRVEVSTRPPRIAYRETISQPAEGQHRHKKQSGGAGQFGEVHLKVEPLPRGTGFEFVDAVKGGTIPGQFMPAVEKGIREVLASGAISGHPVQDVRVIVHDGKHHSVDSKDIAFATAGRKAFLAAMKAARPVVLEPIVEVEIQAPAATIGDLTGDLASRRGQVLGTEEGVGGQAVVRAQVPLAEITEYQNRLNSLTAGQGRYTLTLARYDPVPPQVQAKLESGYKPHEEE